MNNKSQCDKNIQIRLILSIMNGDNDEEILNPNFLKGDKVINLCCIQPNEKSDWSATNFTSCTEGISHKFKY